MQKSLLLSFGAAAVGTVTVFSLSVYLLGVPADFLTFLSRSLVVLVATFALSLAVAFTRTRSRG